MYLFISSIKTGKNKLKVVWDADTCSFKWKRHMIYLYFLIRSSPPFPQPFEDPSPHIQFVSFCFDLYLEEHKPPLSKLSDKKGTKEMEMYTFINQTQTLCPLTEPFYCIEQKISWEPSANQHLKKSGNRRVKTHASFQTVRMYLPVLFEVHQLMSYSLWSVCPVPNSPEILCLVIIGFNINTLSKSWLLLLWH